MTNEEKATIISKRALGFRDGKTQEIFNACMEMAAWKDEQIEKLKCCANCEHSKVTDKTAWEECFKTEGRACEKWEMEGGEE